MLRRFLSLPLLLLLLCGSPLHADAQEPEKLSMNEYVALLEEISVQSFMAFEDEDLSEIKKTIQAIPASMEVTWTGPDGKPLQKQISNKWIKITFQPNGAWRRGDQHDSLLMAYALGERAQEMADDLTESWKANSTDTSAASRVKEILSAKRYEKEKEIKPPVPNNNGNNFSGPAESWDFLPYLFMVLLLVVLVIVVASLGRKVDLDTVPEEEVQVKAGEGLLREGEPTKSKAMLDLADQARTKGELHKAIRYSYLALILKLHESRTILYKSSYTTGEYAALLLLKGFPHAPIREVSLTFDRTVYGLKEVESHHWEVYSQSLNRIYQSLRLSS